MSKMDGLRAMREAKYAEATARTAKNAATRKVGPPVAVRPPADPTTGSVASQQPTAESCGHRSMNGRTCTREPGHAAKSHRYS